MRSRWLLGFWWIVATGCGEGAAALTSPPAVASPGGPAAVTAPRLGRPAEPAVRSAEVVEAQGRPPADSGGIGAIENPDGLRRFFEVLAELEEGRSHDDVRIVQYGDSHTASDGPTAVFRRLLQTRFGDGGRGFVAIGRPWKTYMQDGIRGGMTKEFEPERVRAGTGDGCYGLLGVGLSASRSGARAWTEVAPRASHIEIAYWQDPHGGSADVFVDGSRIGHLAARAREAGSAFSSFEVPDAPHEVELRAAGDGQLRIFGMALDRAQAGVVVDALGINGAQIFTALRWNEAHFAEQLRHRAPALVVVAYGTNEALDPRLSDGEYERGLVELLGRIARATPGASCLLLGPPDLARRTSDDQAWAPWPRLGEIVSIQRRVAQAAGCAFYDQLEAMGGAGSIVAWASEPEPRAAHDRVHFTRSGYAQLGGWFAADLLRAYDAWRRERGRPPTGAARTWDVAQR